MARRTLYDDVWLGLLAVTVGIASALGVRSVAPASHDAGLVRTVGLGWTGGTGGLDPFVASAFALLPVGTEAARTALASAVVSALCAALVAYVSRAHLENALAHAPRGLGLGPVTPGLATGIASVAALSATLAPAWQAEASAPGGAVI
ncbi:MAG: hypothetical protein KC657_05020, partial [Myxococcales bacterium]|nr:hypothetical protein [Myxococcales bacterium]